MLNKELLMTNSLSYMQFDYLQLKQPIGQFYVVTMKFQDVLAISYSATHEVDDGFDNSTGLQRKISPDRKKEIAQYTLTPDATFPTSIILAIKSLDEEKFDDSGEPVRNIYIDEQNRKLNIRKAERLASILDGQHRLEGLRLASIENGITEFELNVTIFVDVDIETQTQIFSVINKSQTKVNKSLVYDLYEYATHRSPFKTGHDVVRALNKNEKSPFYKKIKLLGTAINKETESISQATLVDNIISYISQDPTDDRKRILKNDNIVMYNPDKFIFRKSFIDGKDSDITRVLYCYFDAVRNRWRNSWDNIVDGNILNKTTGVIALMKLLRDVYAKAYSEDQLLKKEFYQNIFNSIELEDGSFTVNKYKPGTKGQIALYKDLKAALEKVNI